MPPNGDVYPVHAKRRAGLSNWFMSIRPFSSSVYDRGTAYLNRMSHFEHESEAKTAVLPHFGSEFVLTARAQRGVR